MKRSTKLFERTFTRKRDRLERKGIALARAMIAKQYIEYWERLKDIDPNNYEEVTINPDSAQKFFEQYYPMTAELGVMVRKQMLGEKSAEDEFWLNTYQEKLRNVVIPQAGEKITSITATSKARLVSITRATLETANIEGWGIDKIRDQIFKTLKSDLGKNALSRARAIAQTEMISASNQASDMAAESTGLTFRKYWSTSGLAGARDSHIEAEQDSNARGGLRKDEYFSNGLMFPGDPSGPPEEVINCRCTCLYEAQ